MFMLFDHRTRTGVFPIPNLPNWIFRCSFLLLLLLLLTTTIPESESLANPASATHGRRRIVKVLVASPLAVLLSKSSPSAAACYYGDTSSECIGVYKQAPAVEAKYKSIEEAVGILQAQSRPLNDEIRTWIVKGEFQEAGVALLRLLPPIRRAVATILYLSAQGGTGSTATRQIRSQQIELLGNDTLGLLGQLDVSIGQALREEMGSTIMAQLTLLKGLQELLNTMSDFVALAISVER